MRSRRSLPHSRGMPSAVAVEALTKRFGDLVAVDNMTFQIPDGAVTAILGPNGAGKTTTLRMLLGLVQPSGGTATINGKQYRELDQPCRHVGAMLESASFHPGRRARDHLRTMCDAARLPIARVDEVLHQVGLTDAGQRRVKGFSLGMRQRLGLAAALLGDPAVLVLDEPANGLDPEGVSWLRGLLRSYADHGRTVLVSSHLLAEVAQTVDEIVVVAAGRLVKQSTLADLARQVAPSVTVRTPHAQALRDALAAHGVNAHLTSLDTVLAVDTTPDNVGVIAAGVGLVIYEMNARRFNLEEYFLALTSSHAVIT